METLEKELEIVYIQGCEVKLENMRNPIVREIVEEMSKEQEPTKFYSDSWHNWTNHSKTYKNKK